MAVALHLADLMGLSREGLAITRSAAMHPENTSCLYRDKAVCDIKSWPGGKAGKGWGSPHDWENLLKLYHFKSEKDVLECNQNPADLVHKLARAGILVIDIAGGTDDVVPYAENGAPVVKCKEVADCFIAKLRNKYINSTQIMIFTGFI